MTDSENEVLMVQARENARSALADSDHFVNLSMEDQLSTYRDRVAQEYERLKPELATEMRGRQFLAPRRTTAGDLIDDSRHVNENLDRAGDRAGDFVNEVDFPGFVGDLLKSVFDANLQVTLQQMESYKDLLKVASQGTSQFIREIDNTAAFGYLADNQSDEFNLDFDDSKKDADGNSEPVLLDKDGNKVDLGDNEIKAKIMDAKIAMAREHRAMIRELILMGVTRLVVDRGTIKASVLFDMKASETVKRADKAAARDSQSVTKHFGGGFLGFVGGGRTRTNTKSTLTVSSVKSHADTSLAAKLAGSVEIVYKTDYFKLDNFLAMYGPQAQQGGQGGDQTNAPQNPITTPSS